MEVKNYIPHPAIQEYVFSISTVNVPLPAGNRNVVTPYPPTPFQSLMFYCSNPISMGREDAEIYEVQPLTVVIGPQYSRLNDRLREIEDLEQGKDLVEKFLLNRASDLKEKLPFDSALQVLFNTQGIMSMDRTASLSCLSLRQFERKSRERIGMNPKLYARILKFSKAYRLHEASPHLSWTSIAYQSGYYDQMHMIRDFKVFAGVNPSVIEQQLLSTPLRMQRDLPG